MGRLGGIVAGLVVALVVCASAQAAQPPGPDNDGTDFFVTIAARQCPTYGDIAANRARNNIQESLRDLGADTPYGAGDPISPAIEDASQPACTPITGWQFTLGRGIAGRPVTGPWGSLSVVSSPFDTDVTTEASIPDRDNKGRILPNTSIAGATTIELDTEQFKLAARSSSLWIQGGTTTDPVLDDVPAFDDGYGFGALRCAIDDLNGDNVEWIQFPSGSRHVYCYAYYVTPPPTSGTIVIRKQVSDPPGADQTFTFEGNVSYTPDQRFSLTVQNGSTPSQTFYRAETRAGDAPWTVRELVPAGWRLTSLSCTHGASVATTDPATAGVSIQLVAGDTVTCTFTDALRPPPGELLLSKITRGGLGSFPFTVTPLGGGDSVTARATTTAEGVPADAVPSPITLDPGTYAVTEELPRSRRGRWHQVAVTCDAQQTVARRGAPNVPIPPGGSAACVFRNRFIPNGSIRIVKHTRGGAGTTGFVISPVRGPVRQYVKTAVTRQDGGTVRAVGDPTRHLRLGTYVIQETATVSDEPGRWTLLGVECDGRLKPFEEGRVRVTLTTRNPSRECRFANGFTADVPPIPPIPPEPPEPPTPPVPSPEPLPGPLPIRETRSDLVVTKRALDSGVNIGSVARFTITVHNAGEATAEQVVAADAPGSNAQLVSARPSQGTCGDGTPVVFCRLGPLAPGATATIRVRVRATGAPRIRNVAAAGTSTPEARVDNNVGRAGVRVRSQGGVRGCSRVSRATAHAAC
jgi:uncharacterized repeat protein (TIGR01451 family)